jgi:hypothetical protein
MPSKFAQNLPHVLDLRRSGEAMADELRHS